jgi:hypothetical protein
MYEACAVLVEKHELKRMLTIELDDENRQLASGRPQIQSSVFGAGLSRRLFVSRRSLK